MTAVPTALCPISFALPRGKWFFAIRGPGCAWHEVSGVLLHVHYPLAVPWSTWGHLYVWGVHVRSFSNNHSSSPTASFQYSSGRRIFSVGRCLLQKMVIVGADSSSDLRLVRVPMAGNLAASLTNQRCPEHALKCAPGHDFKRDLE